MANGYSFYTDVDDHTTFSLIIRLTDNGLLRSVLVQLIKYFADICYVL